MALTASNVRVAITGGIYFDESASPTLPTGATDPLGAGFRELGYLTEDGFTQNIENDTEDILAWQNGDLVRTIATSHALTYEMSLMETNPDTLAVFYGNHTVTGAEGVTEVRAEQGVRGAWVFHVIDGDYLIRYVVPDGQVTERGEVSHVNGEALSYPITISAYGDENGVKAYVYTAVEEETP